MTDSSLLPMSRLTDQHIAQKPLIVIVGPTAVGKSRVAIEVARAFGTEILTADSRQVYRGMNIGTDKPPLSERGGIGHRLIDLVDPDEPFNAGLYCRHATAAIEELYARKQLPLVVGGTGLYVRTLLKGLCEAPPADAELRKQLQREAREQGDDRFYARLVEVDPATAARLHPKDVSKVIRALEVFQLSGKSLLSFQSVHQFAERPYRTLVFGLQRDREALYRRIEERIDWQLAHGMVDETRALLQQGYQRESAAMKGLGYRHVAAHLAGEYDYVEMVRRFKRDTRHFAKRQMTWFRSEPEIVWHMIGAPDSIESTARLVTGKIDVFLEQCAS